MATKDREKKKKAKKKKKIENKEKMCRDSAVDYKHHMSTQKAVKKNK